MNKLRRLRIVSLSSNIGGRREKKRRTSLIFVTKKSIGDFFVKQVTTVVPNINGEALIRYDSDSETCVESKHKLFLYSTRGSAIILKCIDFFSPRFVQDIICSRFVFDTKVLRHIILLRAGSAPSRFEITIFKHNSLLLR
jgi:hypothetical protein